MKDIDKNIMFQFIGLIGVFSGLVFVGLELRQAHQIALAEQMKKEKLDASRARAQERSDKALAAAAARRESRKGKLDPRTRVKAKAAREEALRELQPRVALKPDGDELARAAVQGKAPTEKEVDEMQEEAGKMGKRLSGKMGKNYRKIQGATGSG